MCKKRVDLQKVEELENTVQSLFSFFELIPEKPEFLTGISLTLTFFSFIF